MKLRKQLLVCLLCVVGILSGCGGNDGGNHLGSGSGTFTIYTYTGSGTWENAIIDGYATPGTFACNPSVDRNCTVSFSGLNSGTAGYGTYSTDALPAQWNVGARADNTCPQGASNWGSVSYGSYIPLNCGTLASGPAIAVSPATCTIVYVNGNQQGYCSPYLEITADNPTFPTSYPLAANLYTTQAAVEAGYQENASSSTQIRVPAPTQFGQTVITITDPNTNETLGAVSYVLHECFIQTGPYGTTQNCPY